jgi:hypothetical protein
MDYLEMAKSLSNTEEDLEDQSALYNIVYCFEFFRSNQRCHQLYKNTSKNPYSKLAAFNWDVCITAT